MASVSNHRLVIKTFAILTALDNSLRVSGATNGELRDAGFFARNCCSSLWKVSTDAYSGIKLAATFETDGEIKCHAH